MSGNCSVVNSDLEVSNSQNSLREIWKKVLHLKVHLVLFFHLALHTISALEDNRYSEFDAQTTTNCCHGMAAYVSHTIQMSKALNLKEIKDHIVSELEKYTAKTFEEDLSDFPEWIDGSLLELTGLFLLKFASELVPTRGRVTNAKKLKAIAPISNHFCKTIVDRLKKYFSNQVAVSYASYYKTLDRAMIVNDIPISVWGQYVQPEYLREDSRGILFTSEIFSMQILLASMMKNKKKIAIINDLVDSNRKNKGRFIGLIEGDGENGFRLIEQNELDLIEPYDQCEPVIVFSGYSQSDEKSIEDIKKEISKWIQRFEKLVLANDMHYPQFPDDRGDPTFDHSPISPSEEVFNQVFNECKQIIGVSLEDPSLYCLTHIHPASLKEVILSMSGNHEALPAMLNFLKKDETSIKCVSGT